MLTCGAYLIFVNRILAAQVRIGARKQAALQGIAPETRAYVASPAHPTFKVKGIVVVLHPLEIVSVANEHLAMRCVRPSAAELGNTNNRHPNETLTCMYASESLMIPSSGCFGFTNRNITSGTAAASWLRKRWYIHCMP